MDQMEQLYRDQYAHYLNTTPGVATKKWELEGIGVDSLSQSFNPQVDQYKTIIQRNSDATFKNYQIQSDVSSKRIYKGDPIYEFLDEARINAKAIETQILEVDLAYATENQYRSIMYNCLIVINEFLGENAEISYQIYYKGDPIKGTSTITDRKPVFTESA